MPMPRVVIACSYSDSQKGDLAILLGTLDLLRSALGNLHITVQTLFRANDPLFAHHIRHTLRVADEVSEMPLPSPYLTRTRSGGALTSHTSALLRALVDRFTVEACLRSPSVGSFLSETRHRSLLQLNTSDLVVFKGGGYIYNNQGGVRGILYLNRLLRSIAIARRLAGNVTLFGHSIGPIIGDSARTSLAHTLAECDAIVVREQLSYSFLSRLGLTNLLLAPDPAFAILPRWDRQTPPPISADDGWLGVTVAAHHTQSHERAYRAGLLRALTDAYKRLGLRPVFFPQVLVHEHGVSDRALIEDVTGELRSNGIPAHIINDDLSPSELAFLYGKCELLLGTRLHSCILAASATTPFVAVSYHGPKTVGVVKDLLPEVPVLDSTSMISAPVVEVMAEVLAGQRELRNALEVRVSAYRAELKAVSATVFRGCMSERGSGATSGARRGALGTP